VYINAWKYCYQTILKAWKCDIFFNKHRAGVVCQNGANFIYSLLGVLPPALSNNWPFITKLCHKQSKVTKLAFLTNFNRIITRLIPIKRSLTRSYTCMCVYYTYIVLVEDTSSSLWVVTLQIQEPFNVMVCVNWPQNSVYKGQDSKAPTLLI